MIYDDLIIRKPHFIIKCLLFPLIYGKKSVSDSYQEAPMGGYTKPVELER